MNSNVLRRHRSLDGYPAWLHGASHVPVTDRYAVDTVPKSSAVPSIVQTVRSQSRREEKPIDPFSLISPGTFSEGRLGKLKANEWWRQLRTWEEHRFSKKPQPFVSKATAFGEPPVTCFQLLELGWRCLRSAIDELCRDDTPSLSPSITYLNTGYNPCILVLHLHSFIHAL